MPDLSNIKDFINAIKTGYGCAAEHISSVALKEVFNGETIWSGVVEVFKLKDCPRTDKCYAWEFEKENGKMEFVTVLGLPPVISPQRQSALMLRIK